MNSHNSTQKRLLSMSLVYENKKKLLREQREQELKSQMRAKPKILAKSRQLAKIADQKFFEQYRQVMDEGTLKVFEAAKQHEASKKRKRSSQYRSQSRQKQELMGDIIIDDIRLLDDVKDTYADPMELRFDANFGEDDILSINSTEITQIHYPKFISKGSSGKQRQKQGLMSCSQSLQAAQGTQTATKVRVKPERRRTPQTNSSQELVGSREGSIIYRAKYSGNPQTLKIPKFPVKQQRSTSQGVSKSRVRVPVQLSPFTQNVSYKCGFNIDSFLERAKVEKNSQ